MGRRSPGGIDGIPWLGHPPPAGISRHPSDNARKEPITVNECSIIFITLNKKDILRLEGFWDSALAKRGEGIDEDRVSSLWIIFLLAVLAL